jgi:hypothetical protein
MALLSVASLHCGSGSRENEESMQPITGDTGGTGGTTGSTTGTTAGTSGGTPTGSTGSTDMMEDDAGAGGETPGAGANITGMEIECVVAFTRIAECYLTQDKCTDTAGDNADQLGPALAIGNCADFVDIAGSIEKFAMTWNEQTPCADKAITDLLPQLDGNAQIKELCEAEPLDAAACTSSCQNIVPCASQIPNAQAAMALGDQGNCEANCTMQPALSPVFRCALNAGANCSGVVACFGP